MRNFLKGIMLQVVFYYFEMDLILRFQADSVERMKFDRQHCLRATFSGKFMVTVDLVTNLTTISFFFSWPTPQMTLVSHESDAK